MLVFILLILSAVICGAIAKGKSKNVILWVVLGFFFPLISILILAVSSDDSPIKNAVSSPPPYDQTKWEALLRYDDDIRQAAQALQPLGQKYVDQLAVDYLSLNDKAYLSTILEKIKITSKDDELRELGRREIQNFSKSVSRCYITSVGKIVVLRDESVLAQIDGQVRKYDNPADFRQKAGSRDDMWDEVSDDAQKAEFLSIFREYVEAELH